VSDEPTSISSTQLSEAFQELVSLARAPRPEPPFRQMLAEHFGTDPRDLPTTAESIEPADHPNLQVALDAYLEGERTSTQIVGVTARHMVYVGTSLAELVGDHAGDERPVPGPVQYINIPLGKESVLTCIRNGLVLIRRDESPLAALITRSEQGPWDKRLTIEAMALDRTEGERFLADLRSSMKEKNIYRGATIELSKDGFGPLEVAIRELSELPRERLVLPEGVLERIERHTLDFTRHREKLLQSGRHLKRGLLLHGPPGTGKTLTITYLAGRLHGRTALLVTGQGQGLVKQVCSMARALQPSMVVLEDVDLIAAERTRGEIGCAPLLFDLLNEMDGLGEDTDVVFVLTTNRPDLLEPALAARPGRIDQAIELPLPDEDGRRRLLELYGEGLELDVPSLEPYVARTEGASGAFIRELLRKAALFAADGSDGIVVQDRHLDEALHELLVEGGILTKSLLGADTSTQRSGVT
jgi:ATPase family associated with various cellular activities (AAA)